MSQDTNVENLIINKLTKAQYESISTPDPTQLYFVTDEVISSADVTTALGFTPENASNKVTSISSSSTNTQYPSAKLVYDQLAEKQPTLVSGTNIKTVNNNSLLGSGNINIDSLPSQTGQSGKFLTTDGADASWALITVPDSSQLNYYGTCATGASTQAKVVVCEGFVLETGVSIRVKFTNAQTYNGQPTLNVNSTGAIHITSAGTTAAARYHWLAGEVVAFTYDGTNWIMEDGGIATTTYYGYTKLTTNATSTSTATALTPASLNSLVQNMIEPYPVYSTSATYAVGDRVRHSYDTWECTTAITTAEAWNVEHWKALDPIQTQIDNINATIGNIETLLSEV